MMSIISRGGYLNKSCFSNTNNLFKHSRYIAMKIRPVGPPSQKNYEQLNIELKRPLSPCLLIYKPEMTSMLSITHRITGCGLAVYASALGIGALILPNDISHYLNAFEEMGPGTTTLYIIKFMLSFPLVYHFLTGTRHLIWDTGRMLDIKEVYATGYLILVATAAFTTFFTIM